LSEPKKKDAGGATNGLFKNILLQIITKL